MRVPRAPESQQLALLRGAWGLLLFVSPGLVLALGPGCGPTMPERRIMRVLGIRHVIQAAAVLMGSRRAAMAWGTDALHSSSMLALAAVSPTVRPLANVDAAVAAAFALATRASAPE